MSWPRLAVVTNDYPPRPGGIQQYLGSLLAVYDGDVSVLAPTDGPAVETGRGEDIVRRHTSQFMWPTPRVRRWVDEQLRSFRPEVVLFGAPYPLPSLGPRLRETHDVPYAVLAHGAEITIPSAIPLARQLLRRPLRLADARFAVSRFTVGRVERLTGKPVEYLGAGIDPAAFRPAQYADRSHAGSITVVGCVSRFVPRKGHARLIDAVARLRAEGSEVELLFVGRGRLENELREHARSSGVPVRFQVDVPWDRLGDLYREMDIFAMPCSSRWAGLEVEGLGLVYLEAAATGLPVVTGDSGGAPETVIPGRTGYVAHSLGDLVEALRMLVDDPNRARAMGAAGREFVLSEFTWTKTAERLRDGLERIISIH